MYGYIDRTNGIKDECMDRWLNGWFDGWMSVGMKDGWLEFQKQ
jgi:hypothetical protein